MRAVLKGSVFLFKLQKVYCNTSKRLSITLLGSWIAHLTPEISLRKSFQSLLIAFNCSRRQLQSHSEPTRKPPLWGQEATLCPAAAANEISVNAAVAAVQSETLEEEQTSPLEAFLRRLVVASPWQEISEAA